METEVNVDEQKQVKKRKKKWQLDREREVEELKHILSTSGGRWLLWRILEKCGLYQTTTNVSNPYVMAHKSGQRDLGIWLLKEILEADQNGYTMIMSEAKERDKNG